VANQVGLAKGYKVRLCHAEIFECRSEENHAQDRQPERTPGTLPGLLGINQTGRK
jgi:hypothetical protein